ncbi:hypothetical protein [Acinetobacter sp. 3657]|uniref:hypothetical protein n=1 Tax=Acinetobacter sp. 3657 TaxID=2817764 RepID=UPI00285B85BE|nr:hypothetical protein [Prolinoborus sp. 3657]
MDFKQNELISSGYIFYTIGVALVLLTAAYFILFFLKKNLSSKFSQQSKDTALYKKIKLSSRTSLYILDRDDYELMIVESNQNISITHLRKSTDNVSGKQEGFNEL